jgi:hypothetical protein
MYAWRFITSGKLARRTSANDTDVEQSGTTGMAIQ